MQNVKRMGWLAELGAAGAVGCAWCWGFKSQQWGQQTRCRAAPRHTQWFGYRDKPRRQLLACAEGARGGWLLVVPADAWRCRGMGVHGVGMLAGRCVVWAVLVCVVLVLRVAWGTGVGWCPAWRHGCQCPSWWSLRLCWAVIIGRTGV